MSNRFHNKFHRQNHHSARTPFNENYIDASYDPIASYDAPFEGEFFSRGEIVTSTYLSAHDYVYAMDERIHNNLFVGNDLEIGRNSLFHGYVEVEKDLKIHGNLTVLGHISEFETKVTISSATEITNYGTGPALKITQYGAEPIAHFIDINGDDIIFQDNGYMGLGTDTPNEKLTVVGSISSTNHLTIDQTAVVKQHLTVGPNVLSVNYIDEKVGINVQNPNKELTVIGSISSTGDLYANQNASIGLNASFGTFADSNLFTFLGKISSTSNTNTPAVEITQNGGGDRLVVSGNNNSLVVKNNGNVGIGTNTPNKELTVVGSISSSEALYSSIVQAGSFSSNLITSDQINCTNLTSTNSLSARNAVYTNSAIIQNASIDTANITNVVNISSVTFTGQTTQAVSVSADNTFLRILINGQPKYIRLFDIA
jgi:hypothetical protein